MLNIALSVSGEHKPDRTFNFDISGFWRASKLTTYSSIYLGAFIIYGIIIGGTYIISATSGAKPLIEPNLVKDILMVFLWVLPLMLLFEFGMKAFELYLKYKK